ncbi:hypothetical protein ABB37_06099 [Leptomonas pyrrhocoris]|uniref:NTF2 domain-containing protein n=1 Tax=Leptomonas pyrrhocoris TaxID=157538 RepID=A0A0N0DUF3_LEPPY|nr:hypothetical protein ABB37_06099 [Leptomonas pyrrhocoris]KPA78481.1 hypothetical protein ABB37_06099 [Leptomonas pyrrhocoris]|eukprot:XP_015656920.1 hypothetical protein ABB37_06099 [Leptomonas pyrrhocoris]
MRPADARLQSLGATFAVHYYTTLVEAPEKLAALYTPSAHVVHSFKKASGVAEITALLTTVTAAGVTEVKLEDVSTTRTTAGGIKVTITGQLLGQASPQGFTQEVEMRELESNVFGITSDRLSHTVAAHTAWTAEETPKTTAAEEPAAADVEPEKGRNEDGKEKAQSRKPTPAPAAAAAAAAEESAPAADAEEPVKKPTSFAEALKMKKMGEGAAFSNKAVRVVASDKAGAVSAAAAAKSEKAEKGEKKHAIKKADRPVGTAATAASTSPVTDRAAALVYYDIILKELDPAVTEDEVLALVTPVAPVKLVHVVKGEKRRRIKEADGVAAASTLTFAFVQLERPADAPASHVKNVVTKLSEHHKDLHVEEVREKKKAPAHGSPRAARKPMASAQRRKPAEHTKDSATAPVKPQQKKRE